MRGTRSEELQRFLDCCEASIAKAAAPGSAPAAAARKVFDRCRAVEGAAGQVAPQTLPVCEHLGLAMGAALSLGAIAPAFRALLPSLAWKRRASADPSDAAFWNGHANAMVLGPGGLEDRKDVWIGASLMAPNVTYVDHDHAPEEVYIALSEGEWWNSEMDWTSPGPGGLIYNRPGIRHSMRSGNSPFLALWFLPA